MTNNTNLKLVESMQAEQSQSAKAINKQIKAIAKSAQALQTKIHTTALACLSHAEQFGDARPCLALFMALPKSQRRVALKIWYEQFSPVRINEKTGKCGLMKTTAKDKDTGEVVPNPKYVQFDLEGANESPYWELDEQSLMFKAGPLDLEAQLNRGIAKAYETTQRMQFGLPVTLKEGYSPAAETERLTAALVALGLDVHPINTDKIDMAIASDLAEIERRNAKLAS